MPWTRSPITEKTKTKIRAVTREVGSKRWLLMPFPRATAERSAIRTRTRRSEEKAEPYRAAAVRKARMAASQRTSAAMVTTIAHSRMRASASAGDVATPVGPDPDRRDHDRSRGPRGIEDRGADARGGRHDEGPERIGQGEAEQQQLHALQKGSGSQLRRKAGKLPHHLQADQDDECLRVPGASTVKTRQSEYVYSRRRLTTPAT